MFNGIFHIRKPENEPVLNYAPGSKERAELKARLEEMLANPVEVPCIIGGREVSTGDLVEMRPPHDLASPRQLPPGGAREAEMAIDAANEAKVAWSEMEWSSRATVLLKAAELLSGKYRQTLNAATMLCMSKTCHQAEIDSACELIDFWRFNPYFMTEVYDDQPMSTRGVLNYMEHRPLEGFVFAISPFNFTSIAGNLPTAPALMGNAVVWKPSSDAVLPGLLHHADPEGSGNAGRRDKHGTRARPRSSLRPCSTTSTWAASTSRAPPTCSRPSGSRSAPTSASTSRIRGSSGRPGGKDFIFAHASADVEAAGGGDRPRRLRVPGTEMLRTQPRLRPGQHLADGKGAPAGGDRDDQGGRPLRLLQLRERGNQTGSVTTRSSDTSISRRRTRTYEILCGGTYDDSEGYFIQPTIVESQGPALETHVRGDLRARGHRLRLPCEGVREDARRLCNTTSPYALTGAIFAQDRFAIVKAVKALRRSRGQLLY